MNVTQCEIQFIFIISMHQNRSMIRYSYRNNFLKELLSIRGSKPTVTTIGY